MNNTTAPAQRPVIQGGGWLAVENDRLRKEIGVQKAEIEATLTAKVQKQLNPTTAQGVPWSTAPVQA